MSENPREAIGGNLPEYDPKSVIDLETFADQLRKTYGHLFKERDAYNVKTAKWVVNHPDGIIDEDDMKDATDRLAQILTVIDTYHGKPTSTHTLAKEPFLKGGRIVDDVLNKDLADGLRVTAAALQKPMKEYVDAKVKRLRAEQAANAKRIADEAAAAIVAAAKSGTSLDLDAAMEAEQASLDAIAVAENSKSSSLSMTRGDMGTSSGLRGKWKIRVVNEELLPRSLMMPNMAAIELKMNQSKDKKTGAPTCNIAGTELYEETSLSVRR
jgi:hypothetical protein